MKICCLGIHAPALHGSTVETRALESRLMARPCKCGGELQSADRGESRIPAQFLLAPRAAQIVYTAWTVSSLWHWNCVPRKVGFAEHA